MIFVFVSILQLRQWWNNVDKKTSDIVEKLTSQVFTKALWAEETENINSSKRTFDNMTVSWSRATSGLTTSIISTFNTRNCLTSV